MTRAWLEIVRFEMAYQVARRSMWIFVAVFLFMLIGQTNGQAIDARQVGIPFHAPLFVAESSLMMGMIALFVIAALAGDAATRDVQTRLEPLMRTVPVGRVAFLGGRFTGAFVLIALLLLVVPIALVLAPYVHPDLRPDDVGPFRISALLQAYLLLLLPNAFVTTSLAFAIGTLVRHPAGSWIAAAGVLTLSICSQLVGELLERWDVAKMIDPLGHMAVLVMSRTWSPIDSSTRAVGLDGGLAWNRLVWLLVAAAALAFTCARARRAAEDRAGRRRSGGRDGALVDVTELARGTPVTAPDAAREFGFAARARQTLAITRDSLREVMTRWTWLLVPFLALQVVAAIDQLEARGTPILPTTHRVLKSFADLPPPILVSLFVLIILLAGELVSRERDANMKALADVAPVPDGVRFLGKLLGLWIVIFAWQALLVLAGVLVQLGLGWRDIDVALYLQIRFGLDLIGPLVFALFALSVHVLVDQKHVGHLAVLALVLTSANFAPMLGIEHPLLRPFAGPGWSYSPIRGFEPFVAPVLWRALYWGAWTALIAIVARLFWVRGVKPATMERVRIARRRFTRAPVVAFAAVLGLILLVGGFVFCNTNVLNAYVASSVEPERRAEYERRYGRHAALPQPRMTATELVVDIRPERREADLRGVHRLENRTRSPIDTIHVAVSSAVATESVEFDRPARAELLDDELGHRIYVLEEPLDPGAALALRWHVRYAARGFPAGGVDTAVVGNGTFIQPHEWMPLIGYQSRRELDAAVDRADHGLAARPALPSLDDVDARSDPTGQDRIDLDVTVSTAAEQIAVAPGELLRTWTHDGRRWFHYRTSAPIGNGYAIFSADYTVHAARWRDVALEVVHHPAHDHNVPRMIRGMQASLEQFTQRFGPYPHKVLRMIEYPGAGGSLHATSGTIWYQELFSLFDPDNDPRRFDLSFAAVAHEIAHQWWGGQLGYANVEGAPLLSESLAWYSALDVIEAEHGVEHLRRFLEFMRSEYLRPRSRADVPLLRAADWFLAYRKGPFAVYALREYVGRESVDHALRRLLERHRLHEPPYPTSLDLYEELQSVTPGALQYLLRDLFEANTFWELETKRATAEPTADGAWRVTLDVHARKVVVDSAGVETVLPMDDQVEIGVFARAESGEERGEPLHLAMHRIESGEQTITVTVAREPARAGIDPRHLLIDVTMDDNEMAVTIGS